MGELQRIAAVSGSDDTSLTVHSTAVLQHRNTSGRENTRLQTRVQVRLRIGGSDLPACYDSEEGSGNWEYLKFCPTEMMRIYWKETEIQALLLRSIYTSYTQTNLL